MSGMFTTAGQERQRRAGRQLRGFMAEILTGPYHSPSGGLSAHATRVTIVGANIPDDCRIFEPAPNAPAVILGETVPGYRVLQPAQLVRGEWRESRPDDAVGPMASGAFVHSGDGRWKDLADTRLPLPLHDRYETREYYLSHD